MYVANSSAMLFGGKTPLDFNKKWRDKKPVFGKGKTFKGTFFGIFWGTLTGVIVYALIPQTVQNFSPNYLLLSFLIALGAVLGDILASFFKRRNNIPRGTEILFLDQLDFLFGGLILGSIIYVPDFYEILLISILTMFVHKFSNYFAYKVKLKKVPW